MSSPKVFMTGRLTAEPKLFANEDGTKKRLLFNLACNTKTKNYERTDFVPCVLWGDDRVDTLKPWMLKGRLVEIVGTLRTYDKRDEDGNFERKIIEVNVNTLEFLDRKPEGVETPSQEKPDAQPVMDQQAMMAEMQKNMAAIMAQMMGVKAAQEQVPEEPQGYSNPHEAGTPF